MKGFWNGVVWGMGFGRRGTERRMKALVIESVSLKGEKIVVRFRNVGRDCDFDFLGVYLYERYDTPKEESLLGDIIKTSQSQELLAGYVTNDWIPMNDFREIELKPEKKLLAGRTYKIVVDWGDGAIAYNFTIDDKGGIIPK